MLWYGVRQQSGVGLSQINNNWLHIPVWCRIAFCLVAVVFCLAPWAARSAPLALTIVHVNDLSRAEGRDGIGGIARLATVIAAERARSGHILVTHAGNALSPSLIGAVDQGGHMIGLLNRIGVDVMAVGGHEFDFGPALAAKRFSEAGFPVLSANAIDVAGADLHGARPTWLTEIGGYRIGFIGLTTLATRGIARPDPVTFATPADVAARAAAGLRRQGADLVIALGALSRDERASVERSGAVDILLGGGDAQLQIAYDGKWAYAQSGPEASQIVVLDLKLDRVMRDRGVKVASNGEIKLEPAETASVVTWAAGFRTIDTASVAEDAEIHALVQEELLDLSRQLDVVLGRTRTPLDTRPGALRHGEAAFGNFVADTMRRAVDADIAVIDAGAVAGNRYYEAGSPLRRRDILIEMPGQERTVLLRIRGRDLLAALESGFSRLGDGAERFPQLSGLSVVVDPTRPIGRRITSAVVGNTPLDPERWYTLATTSVLAVGGDGYDALADAERLIDERAAGVTAVQVFDRIAALGVIAPAIEGRITLR
jgi:2',3'-cyclic-nucleotide 2'-phosphodiesterase (5'-nucleotidase family)